MIEVENHGKINGLIKDGVYITRRTRELLFRKYRSFGITLEILKELKKRNILDIRIDFIKEDDSIIPLYFKTEDYINSPLKWLHNGFSSQYEDDLQHFIKLNSEQTNLIK